MSRISDNDRDEQYSVLEDEAEVRFHDFEDESFKNFNPLLDEGPVIISMPFPFVRGRPRSALVGETAADALTIKNTTDEAVELWSVRIYSSNPKDSYLLSLMPPPSNDSAEEEINSFLGCTELEDRVLQPDETLKIWLSCKPQEVGMHTAVIHIVAGDDKLERVAFVLADDQISQALAASKPFARSQRKKMFSTEGFVKARHPSRPRPVKKDSFFNLPRFPVPSDLRTMMENRQIPNVFEDGLRRQNYSAFFGTLLLMEEIFLEEQMRGYDMECVELTKKGSNLMSLVVHGLSEKRPSLVYGDSLFAKPSFDDSGGNSVPFQGYIFKTGAEEIYIGFPPEFYIQHHESKRYDVTFCFNRLSMRKLHLAIQLAEEVGSEILFPCKKRFIRREPDPLVPFNQTLNSEQLRSVEKILACRGSPPYIIHGPPGTGKTVTLVEAIIQICRRDVESRILICAPSNSAADHILDKLVSSSAIKLNTVFRLNAPSRNYEDVSADHLQFCFFDGSNFQCPPLSALLRYNIVVSTYMSSYQLYSQGLPRGHFDYIFLDEAGQASEPETMIPLMGLCTRKSSVVLAGDPMQLGPIVCFGEASRLGLGKSFLERLFDFDFYADQDANYLTKLVKNYRSHTAILNLPSSLFYNGELIACKEESENPAANFLSLPSKEFPVLFVGVQGCDEREGSSPSWFNRTEVSKVVEMVRRLKSSPEFCESGVGVITPYLQQAVKLRNALESVDITNIKVGSVELFQGQEREVIILSTVRSTVKHHEFDQIHSLGFLTNPRRFNVAITRARSLLVIIGNPHVLAKDRFWDKLLRYCVDNGSYQGCPLPEPETRSHHVPVEDAQSRVSKWVSDWDDSIPSLPSNEAEWDERLPNHVSKGLAVPSQYTDDAEWDERLPSHGSKELAIPNQHSNEVEWEEELPSHGSEEIAIPSQYSNEVEWDEELPSQGLPELPSRNSREKFPGRKSWNETLPSQSAWEEEISTHGLDELPAQSSWEEETPTHNPGGPRREEKLPRKFSNGRKIEEGKRGVEKCSGRWRPVSSRMGQSGSSASPVAAKPSWQETKPRWRYTFNCDTQKPKPWTYF